MATHSLESQMEERFITELAKMRREMTELRTLQRQGGDAVEMIGTPLVAAAGFNLTAGTSTVFIVTFTPEKPVVMGVDCYVSIYVDTPDSADHLWPNGALLTASQKQVRRSLTADWATSEDVTGIRKFLLSVENYSPDDHTYYIRIKCYAPKNPAISG